MPPPQTQTVLDAIAEEQHHLQKADARRREILTDIAAALREPARDRTEAARHAMLERRRRALAQADHGLVLGRTDTDDSVYRIGRVGVPGADDGEPLVLDWRADAARPFYTATALEPQGVRRRRHIRTDGLRVTGVDDEDLAGDGGPEDLVGEAALLAALDERRTGRMGSAVATLQREQDAIVRADSDTPLVVQGGPGTGKTVVALHRVAYLLFARPEVARRGVLVLGPSRRFLDYVEQVLPALGETAVVSRTCDSLLPGAAVERQETRAVAELKGRALWAPALARYVDSLLPSPTDLTLMLDGEPHLIASARLSAVLRSALAGDRTVLAAREHAFAQLHEELVQAVVERTHELLRSMEDGLEALLGRVDAALTRADDRGVRTASRSAAVDGELSDEDVDDLRARIAEDRGVAAALDAWWPAPDPRRALRRLLHDSSALSEHAPELTPAEVATIAQEPDALAASDIALLDALTALIGTTVPQSPDLEQFVAARAEADPGWTYGHVVVDEAQELSAMQWHMVRRRCPVGSITAVGDIDQTEAPHRHTDWDQAVSPALGRRWRRADLTICYRTPREVMALVPPVLAQAGSRNDPPRAVRSSGHEPRSVAVDRAGLAALVAAELDQLTHRYSGGTVGVVTAGRHADALRAVLPQAPVLLAVEAKGLEWDACVVVDPDGIAAEPRGWNALYVALTRCTQELVQVRAS